MASVGPNNEPTIRVVVRIPEEEIQRIIARSKIPGLTRGNFYTHLEELLRDQLPQVISVTESHNQE